MKRFIFYIILLSGTIFSPSSAMIASCNSSSNKSEQAAVSSHPPYITIIKAWRHGETEANRRQLMSGGGPDDPEGLTALNENGHKQANELAKLVVDSSNEMNIIYTSDLTRALETARYVGNAFEKNGKFIELRQSKQLREILIGKFELSSSEKRSEAASVLLHTLLDADEQQCSEEKKIDRFRFWKIHPLASNDEIVPEEIIDVENYNLRGETRLETPYQLWKRIHQEFIRIAKENPGATVGISTHGGCLAKLVDALNPNSKGIYLPIYYNKKEIKKGDRVMIPAAYKVENCALIHFKYDSRNDKLELGESWSGQGHRDGYLGRDEV